MHYAQRYYVYISRWGVSVGYTPRYIIFYSICYKRTYVYTHTMVESILYGKIMCLLL